MRAGDRVRFGEDIGTALSHIHATSPFKPRDQWLVHFDDDHQEWVDAAKLSIADDEQEHDDEQQELGARSVWVEMLELCLRNLGYHSTEAMHAAWISERERTVATLRRLCAEHGDNDWDNVLHLSDVIEKHLCRYLPERKT